MKLQHKNVAIKKRAFAKKLKDLCADLYGWSGLKNYDYYEEESHIAEKEVVLPLIGKSPRTIWIEVGNKLRDVHNATWVDYVMRSTTDCDLLIISDLRYPNEADMVKERGGVVIRIDRPGEEQFDDVADAALKDYTGWDHVITNDGTLNDLYSKLEALCPTIY